MITVILFVTSFLLNGDDSCGNSTCPKTMERFFAEMAEAVPGESGRHFK
ncbi:hypothetical protein ACE1TH_19095 [Shouchella sp. JSM 1781072]